MKNSTGQDQRIERELGRYRLAPPSPDLHDRILRAAHEAFAGTDEELHWTARCLRACGAFRQEILAFSSAVMLILGLVMQLGGGQSVLADSLERLKVMVTVSGSLYQAASMDCTVLAPAAVDGKSRYRVRWNTAGISRVDMGATNGKDQTAWISKETVTVADSETGPARSMALLDIPSQWQPAMEFLKPSILAQNMEAQYGPMRAERQDGAGPDDFLIIGREDREDVEITVDARTYLPKMLRKYSHASANRARDCIVEARFVWNQPFPSELLRPRSPLAEK